MKTIMGLLSISLLAGGCALLGRSKPPAPTGLKVAAGPSIARAMALESDGAGSAVVAYAESSGGAASVLLQKLGPDGKPAWPRPAVAGASRPEVPQGLRLTRTSGGWFVMWKEAGGPRWLAQRVSDSGQAAGEPAQVARLESGKYGMDYATGPDGSLFMVYNDRDPFTRTVFLGVVKLSPDGRAAWTRTIGLDSPDSWFQLPEVAADDRGGVYVVYRQIDQHDKGLVLQHFSESGERLLGDGLDFFDVPAYQSPAVMVPDGRGGVLVLWEDGRNGDIDVYAQRISADGKLLWDPRGVAMTPVAVAEGNQWSPAACADGSGGAYVSWIDDNAGKSGPWSVRVQHVDSEGQRAYPPEGLELSPSRENQSRPTLAPDGAGAAVACWSESPFATYGVYCRKVSPSAGLLWKGPRAAAVRSPSPILAAEVAADGKGGAFAAWERDDGRSREIRADRLDPSGSAPWRPGLSAP